MSFADLAKLHASAIAEGPTGEEIEYLPYPSAAWQSLWACVTRDPADEFGNGLANRIRVFISRADLAAVTVQKDRVRLAAAVGELPSEFGVSQIITGRHPGHWWLECVK